MKHSVIIPAYNAQKYLSEAVASVLPQLNANDEIIIVNDGSTDATSATIRAMSDLRIIYLESQTNGGIARARNLALSIANGDWIHFLDHDDLWPPHRMSIVRSVIKRCSVDLGLVSGMVEHFVCPTLDSTDAANFKLPTVQHAALPGSVIFSRELISQVGEFDTLLSSGEFVDLMSRVIVCKPIWFKESSIFLKRRIHGLNHTLLDKTGHESYLQVIRSHLKRVS